MHLVQFFLPTYSNSADRFPSKFFSQVRDEIVERFGGITVYTRSPAQGLWQEEGTTIHDEMVVYEVMVEPFEEAWWQAYRQKLEKLFEQERILMRAHPIQML